MDLYRFHRMEGNEWLYIVSDSDVERREPSDLDLGILSVDRLMDGNGGVAGYCLSTDMPTRATSTFLYAGWRSEDDVRPPAFVGMPGLQIYSRSSDVLAVSLRVSQFYELSEMITGIGNEKPIKRWVE